MYVSANLLHNQPPILYLLYLQHYADYVRKVCIHLSVLLAVCCSKREVVPSTADLSLSWTLQSAWKQHHIGHLTHHSVDWLEGSEKPSHLKNKKTSCAAMWNRDIAETSIVTLVISIIVMVDLKASPNPLNWREVLWCHCVRLPLVLSSALQQWMFYIMCKTTNKRERYRLIYI